MEASVELALCRRLLMMADDELILGHRNSEWAGHAPILEEDIAFANIAQDEMGHAAIWYRILSDITGDSADKLVFFRDATEYRNCQLVELPKGDWARTIVRQYLFDSFELVRSSLFSIVNMGHWRKRPVRSGQKSCTITAIQVTGLNDLDWALKKATSVRKEP